MTEAEWLVCADPKPMLEFLRGKASDRKLRLWACACVTRVHHLLPFKEYAIVTEIAARQVDGLATDEELDLAVSRIEYSCTEEQESIIRYYAASAVGSLTSHVENAREAAIWIGYYCLRAVSGGTENWDVREQGLQCNFLRDIFPLNPILLDPSWPTSTVVQLAEGIYQDRAFDRMPILADALQDAECDNDDILEHCRGEGPHVRGCWLIDLLLGKE